MTNRIIVFCLFCILLTGCQKGCTSRYTGGTTKLPAPENMKKVIGFGRSDKVKWLSYIGTDEKLYLIEYTDFGIFEAKYELSDAKFDDLGKVVLDK